MDPFLDYIPSPPGLSVIDDKINTLNASIDSCKRLIESGFLANSVVLGYLQGVRQSWEKVRCGTVGGYATKLPGDRQKLERLRDEMQCSLDRIRQENEQIVNMIAADLRDGTDSPLLLGVDDETLSMLTRRIERIEEAIAFLGDNC